MYLIYIALLASLTNFLLLHCLIRFGDKVGILDNPVARSMHDVATPGTGGIAIFVSFTLSVFSYSYLISNEWDFVINIWAAAAMMFLLGLVDDYLESNAKSKFVVQLFVSIAVVWLASIFSSLGLYEKIVLVLILVWFVNIFNFMDGVDGFAASNAQFYVVSLILIFVSEKSDFEKWWLGYLFLFLTGFLFYNLPKAKLFLGNGGSYFLGYLLILSFAYSHIEGMVKITTLLIISCSFVADSSVTLFIRTLKMERIWEAHRNHAYQKYARIRNSHSYPLYSIAGYNYLWLLPLSLLNEAEVFGSSILVSLAYLPMIGFICFVSFYLSEKKHYREN